MRREPSFAAALMLGACALDGTGQGDAAVDSGVSEATSDAGSCANGSQDGDEADLDCGGPCPRCADGMKCRGALDCRSGVCAIGRCASSCDDGTANGTETDVDCGGTCKRCGAGAACKVNDDCLSNVCVGLRCQPSSCGDGKKNGTETDVDCGGLCSPCDAGRTCSAGKDCRSALCDGLVCRTPLTCGDLHTAAPTLKSGVYTIDPDGKGPGKPFPVLCEMTAFGGGWTFFAHQDGTNPSGTLFEVDSGLYSSTADDTGTTYSIAGSLLPFAGHTSMLVLLDTNDVAAALSSKKALMLSFSLGNPGFTKGPVPCTGLASETQFTLTPGGTLAKASSICDGSRWYLTDPVGNYLVLFHGTEPGNFWGKGMGGDERWMHDGYWFAR